MPSSRGCELRLPPRLLLKLPVEERRLLPSTVRLMHSSPPTAMERPGAAAQRAPAAMPSSRGRELGLPPRLIRRLPAGERWLLQSPVRLMYCSEPTAMEGARAAAQRSPAVPSSRGCVLGLPPRLLRKLPAGERWVSRVLHKSQLQ
ncbi:hypothetical protein V5799_022314 [Amblyomma americanum]|uniref:Uncharacterized protein n=1 Tax=Amblyomma americanum TaxID=6943 RepID=A0AAQ4FN54_AMBAM